MIRLAAACLVEDQGLVAYEARNADEAVSILENEPGIAVVFTDIQMAGSMDGLALAAYARRRWPPLKFIIVSGDRSPLAHEMPYGAHFFTKPYDQRIVSETLASLI